jgi:hypothetical protein
MAVAFVTLTTSLRNCQSVVKLKISILSSWLNRVAALIPQCNAMPCNFPADCMAYSLGR